LLSDFVGSEYFLRKVKVMDGNTAAALVAYAFTEIAAIYPITPATSMAELVAGWACAGRPNLWGRPVAVTEMQSEAGVAGVMHGSLAGGALASSFTASQGLLLMLPNMYKIAGELLPGVIHVAARAVASHALSIFCDHSDVYGCRATGFAILCCNNVQEVMDLSPIAHLCAINGRVPFLNFFDGFRTSHEQKNVAVWSDEQLRSLVDANAVEEFRSRAMRPQASTIRGTSQSADVFFQNREASNRYYDLLPEMVDAQMAAINTKIGADYSLFNYYGHKEAENIIVAMGSVCDTIEEVIDHLNSRGARLGLVKVRLFRPFSVAHFVSKLPPSVKKISVLDRTKEPGAVFEPLHLDVVAAISAAGLQGIKVVGGRYGLGSKDVTPQQIAAVFENANHETKPRFTIGINDDVTNLSLKDTALELLSSATNCKFYGLGSDGTVGASKNAIKLIGEQTNLNVQGYFSYDSKKSTGLTVSHLRFGDALIRSRYLVQRPGFVACHHFSFLAKYDVLDGIKENGIFLLNCALSESELQECLPARVKRVLAQKNVSFFVVAATEIAEKLGLGGKINIILQAAFFKLIKLFPERQAIEFIKQMVEKTYRKKGQRIVELNCQAIVCGIQELKEVAVPPDWAGVHNEEQPYETICGGGSFAELVSLCRQQRGDEIPVSGFLEIADGVLPLRAAEAQRVAETDAKAREVPCWLPENCIQCNFCSFVCPHAAIRPVVLNQEEVAKMPPGTKLIPMKGSCHHFGVAIAAKECLGCGACVEACPGILGKKALEMIGSRTQLNQQEIFDLAMGATEKPEIFKRFTGNSVTGSQFRRPLLEFPSACAGCGEVPYVRLLTQLFGERLYIANATGCSSIWGGSFPSVPYVRGVGGGPAWANSLLEDNAEFGYGIYMAQRLKRPEGAVWVIGGDGWAYDIGFAGVDHIMAGSGNVNLLVLDNEIYSNTGAQPSKATPIGATTAFTANGKLAHKKDLAMMLLNYEQSYIAQISLGADFGQAIKALSEAESYPGPSLVIAYAPCVAHGVRGNALLQAGKQAVLAGYWHLFRRDPRLRAAQKNPFQLDSPKPSLSISDFWQNEARYSLFEECASEERTAALAAAQEAATAKYEYLRRLAEK
jgi:pyruvate-ferredoxin/flavodoxin oxidoreductase